MRSGWRGACAVAGAARSVARRGAAAASPTMVKWNVDPWPAALSTVIVPPISSVSRLLIASPRPAPPCWRLERAVELLEGDEEPAEVVAGDADDRCR